MDDVRRFQHKIAAARRAWQIMRDPNVVFLDSETTGLHGASFVELGIIDRDGKPLINQRLDPMADIESGAIKVHGIQPYMLVGQPRFYDIFEDVADVLAGKRLVIYNAQFDWNVLDSEITRAGHNPDFLAYQGLSHMLKMKGPHCAMFIYAQFWGQWHDYYRNFTWQKLIVACERFNIQVDAPAHSAFGDCLRTLKVMEHMANWYEDLSSHYKELVA